MAKTVICVPTYNERENIALIVPEIFSTVPDVRVLVIDDNSPDGTQDVVKELQKKYPNLELYAREKKEGLGRAYTAAFKRVLASPDVDAIMTMDADGSHAAEYLPAIREAGKTHDLVIGSRYTKGGGIENWEMWRYALSKFGNIYARALTGLPMRDLTAGFMHIKADCLRRIDLDAIGASGYAFLMDLKFNLVQVGNAKVTEVPIVFRTRREGESKISHHIIKEGLKTPLRLFFKRFA